MDNKEVKKPRPCCTCKPTKIMRDKCILEFGEEKCVEYINSHKECLQSHGFKTN